MADEKISYGSVGVDYDLLDAGKRHSIAEAMLTSGLATDAGRRPSMNPVVSPPFSSGWAKPTSRSYSNVSAPNR